MHTVVGTVLTRTAVLSRTARRGAGPLPLLRGRHADGGPLALDGQALRGVLQPGRLLGLSPLPQRGLLRATRTKCASCRWPVVALRYGRGRPRQRRCSNLRCPLTGTGRSAAP